MLLVALLWGITFPLIREALRDLSAEAFVAYRFSLALVAFLPLLFLNPRARPGLRAAFWPGIGLGLLAWSSYFTQTLGLRTVEAGRAAFITGTSVILVPFLSPLFRAGRPGWVDVGAAAVATLGLFLLTDPSVGGLSTGDMWILACAVTYSLYIHVLQKVLRRDPESTALAFTQVLGIGMAAWVVLGARSTPLVGFGWSAGIALGVCAILATVGTFWLQARFQGQSTPERVALLFAMEPVFATGFAYLLLGEVLAPLGLAGGALIVGSVVGAELLGRRRAN